MAKAAVGSIGAKKSRGPARTTQKCKVGHRAKKWRLNGKVVKKGTMGAK